MSNMPRAESKTRLRHCYLAETCCLLRIPLLESSFCFFCWDVHGSREGLRGRRADGRVITCVLISCPLIPDHTSGDALTPEMTMPIELQFHTSKAAAVAVLMGEAEFSDLARRRLPDYIIS